MLHILKTNGLELNSIVLFRLCVAGLLAVLSVPLAPTNAAESPSFVVTTDSLVKVDTVTSAELGGAKAHLNFPILKRQYNGDLVVTYSVGQTQSGMTSGRQSISIDGGLTWSPPTTPITNANQLPQIIRPPGQLSAAYGINPSNPSGFTSWSFNGRHRSFDGGSTWDNGTDVVNYNTGGVPYTVMSFSFDDIREANGSLYMSFFGKRLGVSTFETVLMVSTNNGKNWTRRSTIADFDSNMGSEGPNEAALVQLNNGNWLAVYRTGQPFPNTDIEAVTPSLFWSISTDDGHNWSEPKTLGVAGQAPQIRKLNDGSIALTFGRYGTQLMFADPSGTRWTRPHVIYNGPTSGFADLRPVGGGKYVSTFDESGFYPPPWNPSPPAGYVFDNDQSANLWAAILDIRQIPTVEDFTWALDYHGDNTPDNQGIPWTLTQSGSNSVALLAELGQDYIHTDTSGAGSKIFHYSLPAATAGSQWAGVDFSQGLIVEFRGRAGSPSTAEGAASILLDDGSTGAITVELDSNSVNLEGLGQVEFTPANSPGFTPQDFHDYRLVVRPDSTQGGAVTAFLYLDGDFLNPILTQSLATSASDQIRFGDQVELSNGILDLDYLRFAPLPQESVWVGDISGNWNQNNHWLINSTPNGINESVLFGAAITSPQTVFTDLDVTAKSIRFNNPNSYTVAGLGQITVEAPVGDGSISVDLGDHQFQAALQFLSDATINVSDGSSLAMNNEVHLNGNVITKSGAGTLAINNILVTDGGVIDVQEGVVTGGGLLAGNLVNSGGLISPGNSPGILEVTGNYFQADSAMLSIEIAGKEAGVSYDVLVIGGTAFLKGFLEISFLDGFEPSLGDSFQILQANRIEGAFESFLLPELGQGMQWNLTEISSQGLVSVVSAVPEPQSCLLLSLAGLAQIFSRNLPKARYIE